MKNHTKQNAYKTYTPLMYLQQFEQQKLQTHPLSDPAAVAYM